MIAITVEAPDLGALERELEVVLNRLRASRPTGQLHAIPSQPPPPPPAGAGAPAMPLAEPGQVPPCPEHNVAMVWKPADPAKARPAAYWCPTFGCRVPPVLTQ
jgi:hypothetical protein